MRHFSAAALSKTSYLSIVLILAVAGVFWQVQHHEFVSYDDGLLVWNNPHYIGADAPKFAPFWREPHAKLYMPLTYTVWGLLVPMARLATPLRIDDTTWINLAPEPYHVLNLVLHLCNTLLVFFIVQRLIKNAPAAFAGALVFAVHPLQVQSVAWISELKGLLSGFFCLAAIWFYSHFAERQAMGETKSGGAAYLAAFLCGIAALLSKPSAAALLLILLVLEMVLWRRPWPRVLVALAPFLALSFVSLLLAKWAQPLPTDTPLVDWWKRPLIAGDALVFYMAKFFWPHLLGINYGRRPDVVLGHWWGFVSWIPVAALIVACWRTRAPELKVALGVFIAWLLPVLGFIPFQFQSFSTVADRYIYLSLLGAALATAYIIKQGNRVLQTGIIAWLVVLAVLSVINTGHWANNKQLFTQAITVNPANADAHFDLANAFRVEDELAKALPHFQEASRLDPDNFTRYANLGDTLLRLGYNREAVEAFSAAVRLQPTSPRSHFNLANALVQNNQLREAEQHYRKCLQLDPQLIEAYNNLGIMLARQGRLRDAVQIWQRSLHLQPQNAEAHYNLANALAQQGRYKEALPHYETVLQIAPNFQPARQKLQLVLQRMQKKSP